MFFARGNSSAPPDTPSRFYLFCFSCIIAFGLFQVFFGGLTDDTVALLDCSLSFLRHGGFYEFRNEVNPPLIVVLYALPALLLTKFPAIPAHIFLHGIAFLLILASLALLRRVLKSHGVEAWRARQWLMSAAFVLIVVPASIVYFFSDREHLIFTLAMPWLAELLLQKQPRWYTTLLAAIAFCIKPYAFILCPLMALFAGPPGRSFMQRTFLNPMPWIMGVVALAYVAFVFLCFPGFIDLLPVILTTYSYLYIDLDLRLQLAVLVAANLVLLFFFIDAPAGSARSGWLAFSAGLVILYLLNGGWEYTYYYFILPFFLFAVLRVTEPPGGAAAKGGKSFLLFSGSIAVLIVYGMMAMALNYSSMLLTGKGYTAHDLPKPVALRLREEAGDRFVMLSTSLWSSVFTTFNAPPYNAFAYDVLWPMPWFYIYRKHEKAPMVFEAMARPLAAALSRDPPPVLFVDVSPTHRRVFYKEDYLTILRNDAAVEKALDGYRLEKTIDMCDLTYRETGRPARCKFEVWRKRATKRQRSQP